MEVELSKIVGRYATALEAIDGETNAVGANARTGESYDASAKSLSEHQAVASIDEYWQRTWDDFVEPAAQRLNVPYSNHPSSSKCDHVFTTDGAGRGPEWAIEVKRLQLIGNNGKANGYGAVKMLSPYLSERSMLHDAARLEHYDAARRHAVIGYSFDYSDSSCEQSERLHPDAVAVVANIRAAVKRNGGTLNSRPLVDFADAILRLRGFVSAPRAESRFEAWRHPTGGLGIVWGWEIRRKEKEPGYDHRHPW